MTRSFRRAGLLIALSTLVSCIHQSPPAVHQLAPAPPALEKATVAYRKVNGHEILADIYRPKDSQARPVIVYIHGGALIIGNRQMVNQQMSTNYQLQAHLLSLAQENGYALVSIDYRLAPETKLPAIVNDVEAAFAWLGGDGARRFHFDTDRIVVVGDSAGGYLTLLTGYRVKPKPKALVVLYGYGDLDADWYFKPNPYPNYNRQIITREVALRQTDGTVISDSRLRKGDGIKIYLYYRQNGLWPQEVSGFNPRLHAEEIAPYEPVRNITREYPPTLLIHGTKDTDVPFEESQKISEQLAIHGVPYIFRPIDKADHIFVGADPAQVEDAYKTMREFMLKYLEAN